MTFSIEKPENLKLTLSESFRISKDVKDIISFWVSESAKMSYDERVFFSRGHFIRSAIIYYDNVRRKMEKESV